MTEQQYDKEIDLQFEILQKIRIAEDRGSTYVELKEELIASCRRCQLADKQLNQN